jgi:adenosylmethionine-8-amino-7-oxononanoate aminotransferase
MHRLAKLDHRYVWHPFTQMQDWLKREPIVIISGKGAVLRDTRGREYLDANSSIWTNLHGHGHPRINAAVRKQLGKIAHSSALGFANEPASLLAERLVKLADRGKPKLAKVFFSDDGSTAMEVALKLAYVHAQRSGRSKRPRFLSLQGAYHGDTVGAVGLGHIDLFHKAYGGLLFKTDRVMSPYCYRCPFNRAKPERADAREYRKCNLECVGVVEKQFARQKRKGNPYAAFVVEPLIQGAAGIIPQPAGWLGSVSEIARAHGAQLIADEVMTGFGRTGILPRQIQSRNLKAKPHAHAERRVPALRGHAANVHAELELCAPSTTSAPTRSSTLFACHQEGVHPDYLCVAKGLTGGYLPMAATLTTQGVFDAFLGDYSEFKTFFHGHSFTGNQLGAAAALASFDILESKTALNERHALQRALSEELKTLWRLSNVGDVRQVGLIAGVELVKNWRTRAPFDLREQAGIRVCDAMARRGVLTRPIGNVIVLMPPYCMTRSQVQTMVGVLRESIAETLGA